MELVLSGNSTTKWNQISGQCANDNTLFDQEGGAAGSKCHERFCSNDSKRQNINKWHRLGALGLAFNIFFKGTNGHFSKLQCSMYLPMMDAIN